MKLSHNKTRYNTEGTVYRQTLRIDIKEYERIQDIMQAEIATGYPHNKAYSSTSDYTLYLKPLERQQGDIVYTNITQAQFIQFMIKHNMIELYGLKEFKIDGKNTCLIIR